MVDIDICVCLCSSELVNRFFTSAGKKGLSYLLLRHHNFIFLHLLGSRQRVFFDSFTFHFNPFSELIPLLRGSRLSPSIRF